MTFLIKKMSAFGSSRIFTTVVMIGSEVSNASRFAARLALTLSRRFKLCFFRLPRLSSVTFSKVYSVISTNTTPRETTTLIPVNGKRAVVVVLLKVFFRDEDIVLFFFKNFFFRFCGNELNVDVDELCVVVYLVAEFHLVDESAIAFLCGAIGVDFVLVPRVVFCDLAIDLTQVKLHSTETGYVPCLSHYGGANVFDEDLFSFQVDDVERVFQLNDFVFVLALWCGHVFTILDWNTRDWNFYNSSKIGSDPSTPRRREIGAKMRFSSS